TDGPASLVSSLPSSRFLRLGCAAVAQRSQRSSAWAKRLVQEPIRVSRFISDYILSSGTSRGKRVSEGIEAKGEEEHNPSDDLGKGNAGALFGRLALAALADVLAADERGVEAAEIAAAKIGRVDVQQAMGPRDGLVVLVVGKTGRARRHGHDGRRGLGR